MPVSRNTLPVVTTAAVAVTAAAALALLARGVATRATATVDRKVQRRAAKPKMHPARRAAKAAAPIGKWWTYLPAAALAGAYVGVVREGDDTSPLAGVLTIVTAACLAALLNERFDDMFPQPPAPPGRASRTHPVFPSGHAFGTSSVALSAAYVIAREEIASPMLSFPVALAIPFASSVLRMVEEKHWLSDIAGGHLAAIALASLCSCGYEVSRVTRSAAPARRRGRARD